MSMTKRCGCGCQQIALQPGKVVKHKGKRIYRWPHRVAPPGQGVVNHFYDPAQVAVKRG